MKNKNCIAQMFNHFHVGSNLASKIPNGKIPFNTYLRKNVANSFFINPVQESEIEKLINNFSKINLGPCSIFLFKKVYFRRHTKLQEWLLSFQKKILNFRLIFVPSVFCQFLASCMKNICILAFTRFWQNMACFLKNNLVLERTILKSMIWSVYLTYFDKVLWYSIFHICYFACGAFIDFPKAFNT